MRSCGRAPHRERARSCGWGGGSADSAAVLELLRTAWQTGGPNRANALFELCFGGQGSVDELSPEIIALLASLEQRAKLLAPLNARQHGKARIGGSGHGKARIGGSGHGKTRVAVGGTGDAKVEAGAKASVRRHEAAPAAPGSMGLRRPDLFNAAAPEAVGPATPAGQQQGATTPAGQPAPGGALAPLEQAAPGGGLVQGAPDTRTQVVRGANAVASPQTGTLPFTGAELPLIAALGAAALLAGAALRRRASAGLR